MITEEEYVSRAQEELAQLLAALDELDSEAFDAELENDILTLEFNDGTKYIVNSHRAARQIWMAAERTAWHFDYEAQAKSWRADKEPHDELWAALTAALAKKLGLPGLKLA